MLRNRGIYLPVDATFYDTRATRSIRRKFGDKGFYSYVKLLCLMLREPVGKLPVQVEDDWQDLAEVLEMDTGKAKEFIQTLQHLQEVFIEDGQMYSPEVLQTINEYTELKELNKKRAQAGAAARWKKGSEEEKRGEVKPR